MAEKVLMIALSPTMEEGTIVRWNKSEGDVVSSGDLLCEVETDKATMEYESPVDGTVLKILVPEGSAAKVADLIAVVGDKGEDIAGLLAGAVAPAPKAQPEPATARGEAGAGPGPLPPAAAAAPSVGGAPAAVCLSWPRRSSRTPEGRTKASPLARKLAREKGLDLAAVTGSGPEGRIVKRDIEQYQARPAAAVPQPATPRPATRSDLADERVEVSGKRKVIAQRLSASKFQAPHYYLTLSVEMDGLMASRARLNGRSREKVSVNAFIVKLTAEAIKRHPMVNAGWQGDYIQRYGSIDIALAVAVPDGLITPIVRNCGTKGILGIDQELKGLIEKARAGRLTPEEYAGATFTLSNLGAYGIEEFTAIINPPGSAIMALGKMQRQPVVAENDELVVRSLMKVTLSCDHRVIDGVLGAEFLASFKAIVENPIEALY